MLEGEFESGWVVWLAQVGWSWAWWGFGPVGVPGRGGGKHLVLLSLDDLLGPTGCLFGVVAGLAQPLPVGQ